MSRETSLDEPPLTEHWRTGICGRWSSGCRTATSEKWWEELLERWWHLGRVALTTAEVQHLRGGSRKAAEVQLRCARLRGQIATPVKGFHVIVPAAERKLGCALPERFVHALMHHRGEPYYVSLLWAAAIHGAAQVPSATMQLMVRRPLRALRWGNTGIDFTVRRGMQELPTEWDRSCTGTFLLATPEVTVFDLVGHPEKCGGMTNVVATVDDLLRVVDPDVLRRVAEHSPLSWSQRLGCLCEWMDEVRCAEALREHLRGKPKRNTLLSLEVPRGSAYLDDEWHVYVNAPVRP